MGTYRRKQYHRYIRGLCPLGKTKVLLQDTLLHSFPMLSSRLYVCVQNDVKHVLQKSVKICQSIHEYVLYAF